jgi:DNA modification methylase
MLILGDSLHKLKSLSADSVDAVVCDPPYGLSFMGKKWDYDVPSVDLWREVFRVLKPGGHVLSFGGTRTYHRMVVNIEDAGFEIRDQVQWLYGSGFPKSHDISKGIDKQAGAERTEKIWVDAYHDGKSRVETESKGYEPGTDKSSLGNGNSRTLPATAAAKQWQGWGTALKPANEPICLARKPPEKGLTVAENVLKWGTGAINVDASRIATEDKIASCLNNDIRHGKYNNGYRGKDRQDVYNPSPQGRWPANIILDETAAETMPIIQDESVSRYFYIAKASKRERNAGMGDETNGHPTIKPVRLMEYLVRMITPPNGICLDPFMGSGTTGIACKNLGFEFIGIELSEEYFEIAEKRINA